MDSTGQPNFEEMAESYQKLKDNTLLLGNTYAADANQREPFRLISNQMTMGYNMLLANLSLIQQKQDEIKTQQDELKTQLDALKTQLDALKTQQDEMQRQQDDMQRQQGKMALSAKASESNGSARSYNGTLTLASALLLPLKDPFNRNVEGFPARGSDIHNLSSAQLTDLLQAFEQNTTGNLTVKRQRFRSYIGLHRELF